LRAKLMTYHTAGIDNSHLTMGMFAVLPMSWTQLI